MSARALQRVTAYFLHTGRLPLVARGASSGSSGEKGKTTESATPKGPSKATEAASSKGTAKTTGAASAKGTAKTTGAASAKEAAKTTGTAKTAEASKPKTPPEVVKSPGVESKTPKPPSEKFDNSKYHAEQLFNYSSMSFYEIEAAMSSSRCAQPSSIKKAS